MKRKNPAAVALGRLGGKAKTTKPKGFAAMAAAERERIRALGLVARRKKAR